MFKNAGASLMVVAAIFSHHASAHDPGALTPKLMRAEEAIAAATQSRDQVLASSSLPGANKQAAESFYYLAFAWDHPSVTVCFWQTDPAYNELINAIMDTATRWSAKARIEFVYKDGSAIRRCHDSTSADIRITLDALPASYYMPGDPIAWDWARYGKIARQNRALVSMSLVHARQYYLTDDLLDFHFLAAHELGHALGLIHEHQRLDCASWLSDAGIKTVWPAWTDQDVAIFRQNVEQIPTSRSALTVGSFDIHSVMMYNFDQRIWRQPRSAETNPCSRSAEVEYPSPQDIAGVVRLYGARPDAPIIASAAKGAETPASPPAAAPSPAASKARDQLVQAANEEDRRARMAASKLGSTAARGGSFGGINPALKGLLQARLKDHQRDRDSIRDLLGKMDAATAAAAE